MNCYVPLAKRYIPRRSSRLSGGEGRSTGGQGPLNFQVSNLNAVTLNSDAGIELVCVDSISAHLYFDITIPALYLFTASSYCKLQSSEGNFPSV